MPVKVRLQTQAPTGSIAWSNRSSNAEKATTTAAAATTTTSRATLPPRGRHAVTAAATAAAERARRQAAPPAKAQGKYYRNAVHAFVRVTKEEGVRLFSPGPVTSSLLTFLLLLVPGGDRSRACTKAWYVLVTHPLPDEVPFRQIALGKSR